MGIMRARWAAIGAAVAVSLGAGGISLVSATSPSNATTFVAIEACRVADTRSTAGIGPRSTPIGAAETITIAAHGDNGDCVGIPSNATALSLNVTAVGATERTFLTIWADTGGDRPLSSSLNPAPGQPPTPNAVSTELSPSGEFNIYNDAGSVNVLVDINGYYTDHHHDDRYLTEAQIDAKIVGGSFDRTIVVNGGGSALDNGAGLVQALAEAAGAVPTAADPWTVVLEPGLFELTTPIVVADHITITGSGVDATTIATPATLAFEPAVSFGVGELRDLSVVGSGVGYLVASTASIRVDSVRLDFTATQFANVAAALDLLNGTHWILDSEIRVTASSNGSAVQSEDADVTMRGVSLESVAGGSVELVYMNGGQVVIDHSTIEGVAAGIFSCCNSDDGSLTVRHSVIDVTRQAVFANFRPLMVEIESSTLLGVGSPDLIALNGGGSVVMRSSTAVGGSVGGTGHAETCIGTATDTAFLSTVCP